MTENACDILLYGTMADIGPVVREDLESHGLDVVLTDFAQNTPRDFWGYGRGLTKAIAKYSPRIVMPIGDTLAMARIALELCAEPGSPEIIVADAGAVDLLDSKVRTYRLAEEMGIPQPRSFTFEEVSAHEDANAEPHEDLGVIFKRDTSFGGSGVHRPRSLDSLRHLIEHENGTPYLIEEYIPGEDLSVDCVRAEGFFRGEAYVSLGRVYTQGPATLRSAAECPEAVSIARSMLERLDYRGVCGFDFRRTPDGRVFLLEANPRFTGGLGTQIARGFDIPMELIKSSHNETNLHNSGSLVLHRCMQDGHK